MQYSSTTPCSYRTVILRRAPCWKCTYAWNQGLISDITIDIILSMNTTHYTYRVTWSQEDNEHVGLCAEFPSLSWLAPTPEKALAGIRRVVNEVVADMRAAGEPVPEALADKHYSGRFIVRVPVAVHRALATEAAEQGISINRLVSAKLAA